MKRLYEVLGLFFFTFIYTLIERLLIKNITNQIDLALISGSLFISFIFAYYFLVLEDFDIIKNKSYLQKAGLR